ncbi:heavy-metal-associated domain-containing protein [Luteibaculum oceani]|uniref:Heavy-metal-associated domain-containing protein n=1 Tax=Luteibaculum oceani TaxID=1294296 RepID=A0A5C6UVP3_9FLAO|nr:heavy-metal-associated domain-containing protein [Luteibaculum oceani]TXC76206.1 heavy-metal-associated domain-containing protein [Luteibaculum oceani]
MKKWIKISLISSASIMIVLVAILAVHIYMVTGNGPKHPTANWQLGKIDFQEPLDSLQTVSAKKAIWSVAGVKQAVFHPEGKNVVFAINTNGDLTHDKVYEQFSTKIDFQAELFQPSGEQLAASCPVIDEESITYKLGSYFQNLFASK